jgi:dipeptidyl aminopeptidase/acylaminoacyl peptidase
MPANASSVRLPLLMWVYPTVGKRTPIYNDFIAMRGTVVGGLKGGGGAVSVKLLAAQGYAVLYMTDMPVIGTNDTYIEQIIDNARSAIDELHRTGIIDRKRVAIGGHSYGAFSTSNLLAHCDLFVTGIALSGACNRTLDPFGFHKERRDLWTNPDLYSKMSPILHAHKITVPVLIFHGMEDDSQSSRVFDSIQMFRALCAHEHNSKLILLPHENHRYSARETILHVLAESLLWLHKYLF